MTKIPTKVTIYDYISAKVTNGRVDLTIDRPVGLVLHKKKNDIHDFFDLDTSYIEEKKKELSDAINRKKTETISLSTDGKNVMRIGEVSFNSMILTCI